MWKKLLIVIISFLGTFSVVYAINSDMLAVSDNQFTAGGDVTGRINKTPSNLNIASSNSSIGIQKGDKVLIGTRNPRDNSPLGWQLIRYMDEYYGTDTELAGTNILSGASSLSGYPKYNVVNDTVAHSAWFSMSTEIIGSVNLSSSHSSVNPTWGFSDTGAYGFFIHDYSKTTIANLLNSFNQNIDALKGYSLIENRYLDSLQFMQNASYDSSSYGVRGAVDMNLYASSIGTGIGRKAFYPDVYTIYSYSFSGSAPSPTNNGFKFSYTSPNPDLKFNGLYSAYYLIENDMAGINENGNFTSSIISNTLQNIRPGLMLDFDTVVFGISQGNANSVAKVKEPKLPSSYSSIYTATSNDKNMKLRILDSTMQATITDLRNSEGDLLAVNNESNEIVVDGTLEIKGNANADNSVVSVLLFNKDGNLVYYKPLEMAKGAGSYTFDTTGIAIGDYQLAIVNEEYDDEEIDVMNSSLISAVVPLRIVDEHVITYTAKPQAVSTTAMTTYEYAKNVNAGQKIGEVKSEDGVAPISYEITSNGDNTYKNFEVVSTDSSNSTNSLNIQIKSSQAPDIVSASNSLKAGTYKFCIVSKDANGDPTTDVVDQNKVCTSLTVNKTNATISFPDADSLDMKIGDSTYTGDLTIINTDITTPQATFTIGGEGIANILTVTAHATDPNKYNANVAITYTGTGLPSSYEVTASIPATDNFNAASTTVKKPIRVYKELSELKWTANRESFTSQQVVANTEIGTLAGKDGISPYVYEIVNTTDAEGKDYASFSVDSSTGIVKTAVSLSVGDYHVKFKVKDAKSNFKEVNAIIKVSAVAQSAIEFKDVAGGRIITSEGITMKFNEEKTIFAEGGDSSSDIEYYVADQSEQEDQIDPSKYLSVTHSTGTLTPIKAGKTIKVYAKRAGDATYGEAKSGFMDVTIEKAEQSIAFNSGANNGRIKLGAERSEAASAKIVSTNATGIGDVTYSSSDPTKVSINENGYIQGLAVGSATITATLNANPLADSDAENYESKSVSKSIVVFEGMSLSWNPSTTEVKAESSLAGASAGSISATNNSGNVTYVKSTDTNSTENADEALFNVNPTTGNVTLIDPITAIQLHEHASNEYKISVNATDGNGSTSIDITIEVENADNSPYFTKQDGTMIASISQAFGENENTIQLYSRTSNGIPAVYQLHPEDTSGTLSVNGLGVVSIHKTGNNILAQGVASEGTGYDGMTFTIPITITSGIQELVFKETAQNHPFVFGDTLNGAATLTRTSQKQESIGTTITYTSMTPDFCSIDAVGSITMNAPGQCSVKAANRDANWQAVEITKTINLYEGMGVSFTQDSTPQAGATSALDGSPVGYLEASDAQGDVEYEVVTSTTDARNADASFFTINSSGIISLNKDVKAADIATKYDTTKNAYILRVQFQTTDTVNATVLSDVTTNAEIEIKGALLNVQFDTGGVGTIRKEYRPNDGTFTLNLTGNAGGGSPTYRLKDDPTMPTDVLKEVRTTGVVVIDNANDLDPTSATYNVNPVKVEAKIPPKGGYEGKTIEGVVEITKAQQTSFRFSNPTIQMQLPSTTTPTFNDQCSANAIILSSDNESIVEVVDEVNIQAVAEGTATITAVAKGDRNYQDAITTATVTVSNQPPYNFVIQVPRATYGDTNIKARTLYNQGGANRQQTWSSSDPSIAEIAQGSTLEESGPITIHKAGSVQISCTQTTTGELSATHTVTLVIKPKPITIKINDKEKFVGENVPEFDITIPNGALVGEDEITAPTYECLENLDMPVTEMTQVGSYSITATFVADENPNYEIKIDSENPAKLTVKQDRSSASWYYLEGATSGITLNATDWHKEDVKVVLDTAVEETRLYDEISLDNSIWNSSSITVSKEDNNEEDIYFRDSVNGILSTSQHTTIMIDKTKPVINSITGMQTNKDSLSILINNLTFGAFFRPGTNVEIKSEDILPTPTTEVSGVKEINYEVYEIERTTGIIDTTPITSGILTPDENGISRVDLHNVGLYRVCAVAMDNAGHNSPEICSDLNVKKIDIDIDNDEENEYQDPDNDGCPDINIPLRDEDGNIYKLNVDRDEDGIPDLNIDSDGDGIAEINVDTDEDGKPDLNLVNLTKWEPTFCVVEKMDYEGKLFEYCTMKDIKPLINIDTTKDGIPDINIDTKGDMKADINIDRNEDGKLDPRDLNITAKIKVWNPVKNLTFEEFSYDTQDDLIARINVDTTGQAKPDLNIDTDDDELPDINIDANGDGIPETNVDGDGDGLANFNLDPERTGTPQSKIIEIKSWIPDMEGEINGILYLTMNGSKLNDILTDGDSGIQIQKPDGVFLPNYSIKVNNVKDVIEENEKGKIEEYVKGNAEIKEIFDVKLSDGTSMIQPDGSIKVRIPVNEELVNAPSVKVVIEQADGTYKEVSAIIKDGYIEYETNYLGKVGIIADKEVDTTPDNTLPDTNQSGNGSSTPNTSVKGNYMNGVGGANTGDIYNVNVFYTIFLISLGSVVVMLKTKKR